VMAAVAQRHHRWWAGITLYVIHHEMHVER
jgi:hypothetical protein